MQQENLIWQLIARSLSGEASKEEIALLNEQLQNDNTLQQQYEVLKHFWYTSTPSGVYSENENRKKIAKIFEKADKASASGDMFLHKRRKIISRRIFAVSFSSVIIVIAAIALFRSDKIKSSASPLQIRAKNSYQLVAQKGNRSRTVLPDGSQVWLNAGSVLTYNNFSNKNRQVYLKGEAFFNVVKDPVHPFIVHANSIDIKVLGTSFNVKSYLEDNTVEATLIKGIIQVTRLNKTNDKPVFLHPNEKLIIDLKEKPEQIKSKPDHIISVFTLYHLDSMSKTENLVETSWMYNKLEFRNESFEQMAKKLERWYNIKIFFEDDEVKKLNLNGSFENETLQEAFEALKVAVSFDYVIKGEEVFITSSK